MVKHSPAPWKLYSGKLRPKFPTPIIEIHDKNGEAIVAWLGFDNVKQSPARKLVNARLFAKALSGTIDAAVPFTEASGPEPTLSAVPYRPLFIDFGPEPFFNWYPRICHASLL